MDILEFTKYVKENIADFLPDDLENIEVKEYNNVKQNQTLHGICIRSNGNMVAPVFYMEKYYDSDIEVISDEMLKEIANDMLPYINDSEKKGEMLSNFKICDFDAIKQYIVPVLLNYDNYRKQLEKFNFRMIDDMAIILQINLPQDLESEYSSCIKINKDLEKTWNKTFDEIYDVAVSNIRVDDYKLIDVVDKISGKTDYNLLDNTDGTINQEMLYEISNKKHFYGSNFMLNKELLEKLSEKFIDGYYIIPSSLHECLVISKSNIPDSNDLKTILNDINNDETLISKEEVLSDCVFYYDWKFETIKAV